LDYYTRTVFEFVSTDLGTQGTVCGGGRYDGLIKSIGGKDTPCVGFGLGLERLLLLIEAAGAAIPTPVLDYFVIVQTPEAYDFCVKLTSDLRAKGYSADTDNTGRSLKSQFKYAEKQGAKHVIVVGLDEVKSGEVAVKRLSDGHEERVKADNI
jgi:histidyl-tRNA synthetase